MTPPRRGRFIVLEGIDGAGTTTQTERLVARLRAMGRSALATREPSDGPIGVLVRQILHGQHRVAGEPLRGGAMALLFAADRIDHLHRAIEPALAAGTDVVSDRYLLSSLAYQAEEADRRWVASLARDVREPDLTLLLDVPVDVAAGRRERAGRDAERYDDDGFLARVADNYRRLARERTAVVVLAGAETPDAVAAAIAAAVERLP